MEYKISKHLSYDIKAGITVFFVAIPLCLGIALASGSPVISGIISGVVGGIVIGFLSASPFSVSGPAAGLVTVVFSAIVTLGSFELFLLSCVIAGVLQVIFGYLKLGVIAHYIPYSVIKGMLAAIGLILIVKQIPTALGYDSDFGHSESFVHTATTNSLTDLFHMVHHLSVGAIIISAVSLLCLYVFSLKSVSEFKLLKNIPAALVVIIVAVLLNNFFIAYVPNFALYGDNIVNIPNLDLNGLHHVLSFPDFSGLSNFMVYKYAFIISIVASIETLLSIEAADKLDPEKRVTPTCRELKAQGVGNIISGFVGGLPLTSVVVRTSVNVDTKAKSKASTIIHGGLLLICLFVGTILINQIPLAALAVILFAVGYKLISKKLMTDMFHRGWGQFVPFAVTIVAVFFTDLLTGVLCGLVVSIVFILKNYYALQNFELEKNIEDKKYTFVFSSYTTFLSKPSIQKALNDIPKGSFVTLNFEQAKTIDSEVNELIDDFIVHAESSNIETNIVGR